MENVVESICALAPGKSSVEVLETRRQGAGLQIHMVETEGPAGHVTPPPMQALIISMGLGDCFHYRCDLGFGAFSGLGLPSDFIVAPPDARPRCEIDDWHRLRFLGIPADFARRCLARDSDDPLEFGVLHSRRNHDPYVAHTLDAIWQELRHDEDASRLFLETAVTSLLARLERLSMRATPLSDIRGGLTARQATNVLDYMCAHMDRNLSLKELAEVAGFSPWHFARAFRESQGLPPHRCLTRLRLEKARELLARSRLSITEIAAATGYSSQQLARHFRRNLGCSPSQYRRQTGQQEDPRPRHYAGRSVPAIEPQSLHKQRKIQYA